MLIFVVIGVGGFGGYMVWNNNKDTKDEQTTTLEQDRRDDLEKSNYAPETETTDSDEKANWEKESSTVCGYSYSYPNESESVAFTIETDTSSSSYERGERVNNAGVNYTCCGSSCGLVFSFTVAVTGSNSDVGEKIFSTFQFI